MMPVASGLVGLDWITPGSGRDQPGSCLLGYNHCLRDGDGSEVGTPLTSDNWRILVRAASSSVVAVTVASIALDIRRARVSAGSSCSHRLSFRASTAQQSRHSQSPNSLHTHSQKPSQAPNRRPHCRPYESHVLLQHFPQILRFGCLLRRPFPKPEQPERR
jgi:hypothetical protein